MRPTNPASTRRSVVLPDGTRTPLIPSIHTPPAPWLNKLAAFSPGIDAMNAQSTPEAVKAQFDASITQSGYQRFGSKFPDLVPHLITLRLLASDVDAGTAFGALVLDIGERTVYVPMVVNDSRFEEMDIVYDKATDQFAPLTLAQLRYLRNRGTNVMGTARALPQSVPTDVDIRSLMLPPETGRYSYASAPLTLEEAELQGVAMTPDVIQKTAGFPSSLGYTNPRTELQTEVLRHLAKEAPEVFGHLPDEHRNAIAELAASEGGEATPHSPLVAPEVPHGEDGPVPGTIRTASDPSTIDADLAGMIRKIASLKQDVHEKRASAPAQGKLLTFLEHSPNAVKTAFVGVLNAHKDVASKALRYYGPEKLASAVQKRPTGRVQKSASLAEIPFRLGITNKEDHVEAFGPDAGKALRGVKLRGYYYRTEGLPPNQAITEPTTSNVQLQRPTCGESGAGLSGVLMLRKRDGSRVPALVISQPYNLQYGDAWSSRSVVQPSPSYSRAGGTLRGGQPSETGERDRRNLVIFGDTSYYDARGKDVFGDPVPDSVLEGTALWKAFKALSTSQPRVGKGVFLSRNGAAIDGTAPMEIRSISTGSDGIIRGVFAGGRPFECDPRAAIEKIINTDSYDTLYIPASWRWLPLGEEVTNTCTEFYLSADDAYHSLISGLVSKSERASVLAEGTSFVTSAAPGQGKTKIAALSDLSSRYQISGADAEALLKIAELNGRSSALIVPRSGQLKQADAALESAFGSTIQDLQAQLQQLQGQLDALMSVQQRAQQMASAAPAGDPATDPMSAQMTDPGMGEPAPGDVPAPMDPAAAPMDPAAAGAPAPVDPAASAAGAPAPVDPAASAMPPVDPQTGLNVDPQTGIPAGTVMDTEGPAAAQVQSQVNPNYLQATGALDDASVFDVGLLAEMQRAAAVSQSSAALDALLPINTKDLAETVDDLGRALLNLYLRGSVLNEQLGVQAQARMVGQIRRSFTGLGELLLDLRAYKAGARASLGTL